MALGYCKDAIQAFLDCVAAAAKDGRLVKDDGTLMKPLPCLDTSYSFRKCMKLAEMDVLRKGGEVCKECKDACVALDECMVTAQKDGDDIVERCHEATVNLKKCLEAVYERAK